MMGSPLVDEKGRVRSILITLTDITGRKQADAVKWKMTHIDTLTGLPNRQLFHDRLDDAVKNAKRLGDRTALMFLDLDHFKEINDSQGHPVGDKLLRAVSAELAGAIRETDTVARLGGDEFALIITHLGDDKPINMLAQQIIDKVSQPYLIEDTVMKIGTSIGICVSPLDGTDPDELIRKADHALYQAKADGRNCYHIYDKALHARIASMAAMENELQQALDREEFVLHYQPQYGISGGHVVGAEALIRWNHPERGFLYPGDFIPVAESSGLVIPMGKWVLAAACHQNKAWQDQGLPPFRVSVNVAASQFQTEDFVVSVEQALAQSGLEARWLEIEITESMMLADSTEGMDESIAKLGRLCELGVEIAVDDFGTGYSSLNYLKLLPLHRLKIDRSFVQYIDTDASSAAIVTSVIGLAHSLGLKAIAEGVETAEQHAVLDDQGCDEIQGYFLGRPQAAADFVNWISDPAPLEAAH
jgi:diguanylate cyclase (GGDEF)-like protein